MINFIIAGSDNVLSFIQQQDITQTDNDVIKWKHFPRYWPFVQGIHQFIGHQWIPRTKVSDAELW